MRKFYIHLPPGARSDIPIASLRSQIIAAMGMTATGPAAKILVEIDGPIGKLIEFEAPDVAAAGMKIAGLPVRESPIYEAQYLKREDIVAIKAAGMTFDEKVSIQLMDNMKLLGFDEIWADPDFGGGRGLEFFVIDTGIDNSDKRFGDRILEVWASPGIGGALHWHATWVASIIGRNRGVYDYGQDYRGGCFNCSYYDIRVLDGNGQGSMGTVAWGINKAIEINRAKPSRIPRIINMSLGGMHEDSMDQITNLARSEGILVIVAAGNSGTNQRPCDNTLMCPADAQKAIGTGATSGAHGTQGPPENPKQEQVQDWSSRNPAQIGPTETRYEKRYVVAPGLGIRTSADGQVASGTSGARPMNATSNGATIHRLARVHPDWTSTQILEKDEEILFRKCLNLGYDGSPKYPPDPTLGHDDPGQPYRCLQGYGRVQAGEMYKEAAGGGNGGPTNEIVKVEFYLDTKLFDTLTTPTQGTVYKKEAPGLSEDVWHEVHGIAYDKQGNTGESDQVMFKVKKGSQPTKVVCRVNSPTPNQEFDPGSTVTLEIEAYVEKPV
ncbi:MAG: S8 family serine peptidase [archaeon]